MAECNTTADHVTTVVPGVCHWTVQDEQIDFRGDAYAVNSPEGWVLIDPLPLSEAALASLGRPAAICLTGEQHQRAAWSYRRRYGIPVHAPRGVRELEEAADAFYVDGQTLPGGLCPVLAPGSGPVHYVFLLDHGAGHRIVFCGDLVMREADGPFFLIPDYYVDDPGQVRVSVAKLIDLFPETLCPAHGAPLVSGGIRSLEEALRSASG
jgi:glyoxylase-like metal-dependent hydrolase (beta-lactamase superfamily II)